MSSAEKSPKIPPRWIVLIAWKVHRAIYKITGGRRGLWPAQPEKWGAMRVTMAMNGWGEGEPAWWLNLLANPAATVELSDGKRTVSAAAATSGERERLWARWRALDDGLEGYARMRSTETAVVVLSPRD